MALHERPGSFAALRNSAGSAGGASSTTPPPGTSGRPGTSTPGRGATTPSTSPVATTPPATVLPATGKGAPVIAALSPASGSAGQRVTITGSNFLSADDRIVAYFGASPAPTSCPSSDLCVVSAPSGLSGTVAVQVRTESGASNAASFRYGTR
ncbi:MAG TPA: IPT/TIG domain-containing protein [Acidimicrobiales bacterium]|nr:IPT/TIG domain-containing protein [Acidimicrobiales bacterium]